MRAVNRSLTRSLRARLPFYGWAVVASATLASFCAGPGQPFVFSVFVDPIVADTTLSRTDVSGLYAIGTMVSAATMILIGRLVDRVGGRIVLIGLALAMGAACFLMASAVAPVVFFLAFASLRVIGQGFNIATTLIAAQWFVRYRGRAMMIVGLGFAGATGLLPVTARALIDAFGWRNAYMALGVMVWSLVLPVAIFVIRDRPEVMGRFPDGAAAPPASEVVSAGVEADVKRPSVLRSLSFWLLALPMAGTGFTSVALIFHQSALFRERGIGPDVAAAAFVPFAVASASGTFLSGFLVDRFGPKNVLLGNLGLLAIPPLLLFFIDSTLGAVIYAALLGGSMGIEQVISRAAWAHYYGRIGLGRVQGPAMMLMVVTVAISPLIISQLQGLTGDYRSGLLLVASIPIVTAPMVALHRAPRYGR